MPESAMLIGSTTDWTDQTMTAPAVTVSASTGDALYLDHDTAALSIFAQMEADADITSVELLQNGKILITLAASGALTWGSATTLRDVLGFSGDKPAASTHTSDNPCQLCWMPTRHEIPEHPLGVVGSTDHLIDVAQMRDGTQTVVRFGGNRRNRFRFAHVPAARFWSTSESNQEFRTFFDQVLIRGRRFMLYRNVDIDTSSSSAVSYSSPLGPYQADLARMPTMLGTNRAAGFEQVDVNFDVSIPVIKVAEYS